MPHDRKQRYKSLSIARRSNVPLLGRTRLMAHLQRSAIRSAAVRVGGGSAFPRLASFFSGNYRPWIWNYVKGIFKRRFKPYPTYAADGRDGIYPMRAADGGRAIRIGIAGDWGTGTREADLVSQGMQGFRPDYTIHLGDVYYVGNEAEVRENFLGEDAGVYTPVPWPKGRVGTFALVGNHEMYGGGAPYFGPMLGYCETGAGGPQRASFFALETEHWRVIGLDTGYNSVGTPVLGSLPGVRQMPLFHADCHLEDELLEWLRTNVKPGERRKATLLLSHHQYFSAFGEEVFAKPARQLSEFFAGQDVVWIWGHEHRLAVYERYSPDGSLTCYGRCLGNGGMPVECGAPKAGRAPLAFWDARKDYPVGDGTFAGWNGFLNLTIEGPTMRLDYRDLENRRLFEETFVGIGDGGLQYGYERPVPVLKPLS